jgi:hypothetical protein
MKRTPSAMASESAPLKPVPVPVLQSGAHVFAVPETEQFSDPVASYPKIPRFVEENTTPFATAGDDVTEYPPVSAAVVQSGARAQVFAMPVPGQFPGRTAANAESTPSGVTA